MAMLSWSRTGTPIVSDSALTISHRLQVSKMHHRRESFQTKGAAGHPSVVAIDVCAIEQPIVPAVCAVVLNRPELIALRPWCVCLLNVVGGITQNVEQQFAKRPDRS